MIDVVKNDLNIHYPPIDKIKSGQVVKGWAEELGKLLEDGMQNASVGGGTIPSAKRNFFCAYVQVEFELSKLNGITLGLVKISS